MSSEIYSAFLILHNNYFSESYNVFLTHYFIKFNHLKSEISKLSENQQSIKVDKCSIKKTRNDDYDILINNLTAVMPSPQKIELPQKDTTVSLSVTITSIDNVPNEALINLTAQ